MKFHNYILVLINILVSISAISATSQEIRTKQMLVMLDEKFDGAHLQRNLVELVKQDRRRQLQQNGEPRTTNRNLRRRAMESTNEDLYESVDQEQEQGVEINIKKEIHHSKVGKRTIHIEVHEDAVSLITSIDGVSVVEEDGPVWTTQIVSAPPPAKGFQSTITSRGNLWGIDRLDQRSGLDTTFSWDNTASDIDMYIIDSGVYAGHDEFYGRVQVGEDFYNIPSTYGNTDCNGHGTHVASTAAGKTYGIAKRAQIIPVRAVGCDGRGTVSALISSLQYAIDTSKTRNRKSVVNISLSSSYSVALNTAVSDAVQSGLVVVVAAGNNGGDACNYSPSSELSALTVGASSSDDSKPAFSNTGSCVDIFAPGDGIIAASPAGPSEVASKRGTSMASPNAAGVAAVVWSRNPSQKNTWVVNEVIKTGVKSQNIVDRDCSGKINPDLIVQLPASSSSDQLVNKNTYVANGQRLNSDFFDWPTQFATGKNDGNICVMFDAIITNGDKSGNGASIGVSFASNPNQSGHSAYEFASTSCKSPDFSYYTMNLPNGYQASISKNAAILSNSKTVPNQLVNGYNSVSMYARITRSGITSTIEIGTGNVLGQNVLASAKETSSSNPVSFVSFSSSYLFDVTYSNIRWCDGTVPTSNPTSPTKTPSIPTKNPTLPTPAPTKRITLAPTDTVEFTFAPSMYAINDFDYVAARGVAKGTFQKFWTYNGLKSKVCFKFQARGLANVLVALTETDDEFQYKRATNAYVFMIGKSNVAGGSNTLSKGSTQVIETYSDSYLDSIVYASYKVEMVGKTINVWVTPDDGGPDELMISYQDDPSSILNPKFLSLTGVGKSDVYYKTIESC